MAILDHRGNPVSTKNLSQEIATPNISGVRQPFHEPINNLTPERLSAILLAINQGDATEYLTLAEQMEERELHYASVLRTRKLAVSGLSIAIDAVSDDKKHVEQADACRGITKRPQFRTLIADQCDAFGKGLSVSEIQWDKTKTPWKPAKYIHRDARWFQFDKETGQELRLRDEKDPANGIALEPYKFVVHYPQLKTGLPIRGGLALLAAIAYMCKSYALKDWMVFAEVFGMPLRLGKYDESATTEQKQALLRALTSIGTDSAAMIPKNMELEFPSATSAHSTQGGDKLFQGLADWWDRQVSKGVLGQVGTTEGTPGKLGNDESQENVRTDIRDDDALKLAATLQRDVIKPFIDLKWGPQDEDEYPTLRLFKPHQEDLKAFTEAIVPHIDRGLRVGASAVRDKFGMEEPADDEEVLHPVANGAPKLPGPKDKPEPSDKLAAAREAVTLAALERVAAGKKLTADQRLLLQLASQQDRDDIDLLTDDAIEHSDDVVDPMIESITALANQAGSLEELQRELADAKLDTTELLRAVATMTFKARGLGDVKDKS